MNLVAIIQCRMTSQRYPGKMLAPFLGKTVLDHVIERIKKSKIKPKIILATSKDNEDNPLAIYGKHLGLKVVRGSRNDVTSRFVKTLKQIKCEAFFRVCGDSPLLLPFLFDEAANIYKNNNLDLVTNILPRTFPAGMSIELINAKTFMKTEKLITGKKYREHITKYFYKKNKNFKISNILCNNILVKNLKLALDNPDDLKKLENWDLKRKKDYEKIFPIS